tara:strand:+ start:1070 stop:1543 length:474 start_codon:yes stop_codon:yes gene_type:complete
VKLFNWIGGNTMGGNPEVGSIEVKKVSSGAKLPSKAHATDAGFDLYAAKYSSIPAGETKLIGTGIAMAIPRGYAGLIWDRSSMGVKGLHRFGGVIDSDYRGEIKVCIHNASEESYTISEGHKIAQLIIQEVPSFFLREVDTLEETKRGGKGFGSSGI